MVCLAVSVFYKYVVAISQILLFYQNNQIYDSQPLKQFGTFLFGFQGGWQAGWLGVKWRLTERQKFCSRDNLGKASFQKIALPYFTHFTDNSKHKIPQISDCIKVLKTFMNIGFHLWPGFAVCCLLFLKRLRSFSISIVVTNKD